MRKLIKIAFIFCLNYNNFISQINLVQNPSFEEYTECPNDNNGSLIEQALHWSNPNIYSPDYFNSCDQTSSQSYSVPDNNYGNQPASTGNAYVGIITVGEGTPVREYVQNRLSTPLVAGKTYCVSFYVSASDKSQYVSNDIGAYFSNNMIFENSTHYLPLSPQIYNNPNTNPLTDKIGWTEVSGIFVAQGGEQYMIIGNFLPSETTNTTHFENWTLNYSYHYIDDVSVKLCDDVGVEEINMENDIRVFPNPTKSYLNITYVNLKIEEIVIFNYIGEKIIDIPKEQLLLKNIKIDFTNQKEGSYILSIKTNSKTINKLIINH